MVFLRWWRIFGANLVVTDYKLKMSQYLQRKPIHTSSVIHKSIPRSMKGKSKSSQEWLTRQLNDPYVKKALEMNYRARSAFKLIEIDDKAKILRPGQTVVECGAAPGAWTQVIVKRINSDGQLPKKRIGTVIGIDLLPIAPLDGALLLGGHDFTTSDTLEMIKEILRKKKTVDTNMKRQRHEDFSKSDEIIIPDIKKIEAENKLENDEPMMVIDKPLVDVVLSDMAPNATGNRDTDHPRIIKLVEQALQFSIENGKNGGHFLAKVWDGHETKRLESCISKYYDKVSRYKPPSSRNDSAEIFILGKYRK